MQRIWNVAEKGEALTAMQITEKIRETAGSILLRLEKLGFVETNPDKNYVNHFMSVVEHKQVKCEALREFINVWYYRNVQRQ